jgi:hypothetical protein
VETQKGKFCYWLVAIGILLFGYGRFHLPITKGIPHPSVPSAANPSFHQNYSLKFAAEAASFEGIYVSGRSSATEDKSKPYAKYVVSHPGFDVYAHLASVYIQRFSTQAHFSTFLYLLYCVLII